MPDPRISQISKSIRRVYNVAKYESLEVTVSFQETVEWNTLEERQKKSDNITVLLMKDFDQTREKIFNEMAVSEQKTHKSNAIKQDIGESVEDLGLDDLTGGK